MAELREVFEMATKQTEPERDSWRQQQEMQDRSKRKSRVGATLIAAVLVGVALVAVLATTLTNDRSAPSVANQPTIVGPGEAGQSSLVLDLTTGETSDSRPLPQQLMGASLYAISPDGESVAYGTCCTPPNFISVVGLDGSNERRVTPDGIDAYGPNWSPDGRQLVYQGRDGTTTELGDLFVVDVSTGTVDRVTHLPRSYTSTWSMHPSFTPDGERIIFHMPREDGAVSDLWSVDADGGEPTIVRRDASFGEYSPDGTSLAYVDPTPNGGSALRVVLPSDDVLTVARGEEFGRARWSPDGSRLAYSELDVLYVFDVATGDVERVTGGGSGAWLHDGRLLVVG